MMEGYNIMNKAKYVKCSGACVTYKCHHYDIYDSCDKDKIPRNFCFTCKKKSSQWTGSSVSNLVNPPRFANQCDVCKDAYWMPWNFSQTQLDVDPETMVAFNNGKTITMIKFSDLVKEGTEEEKNGEHRPGSSR